jgi:hypothetical protein
MNRHLPISYRDIRTDTKTLYVQMREAAGAKLERRRNFCRLLAVVCVLAAVLALMAAHGCAADRALESMLKDDEQAHLLVFRSTTYNPTTDQ